MIDADDAKAVADQLVDIMAHHLGAEDYAALQEAAWAIYEWFYGDEL